MEEDKKMILLLIGVLAVNVATILLCVFYTK